MSASPQILDRIYEHELARRDQVLLTRPIGDGRVVNLAWAEIMDQARRMAAHLQERGLRPGDRVAMLAKNSAHLVIAEIAIWLAGDATVALFPTETPETVRFVLEHSEAGLLFIGKLDAWEQRRGGVTAGLP